MTVCFSEKAKKQIDKLDSSISVQIESYLRSIEGLDNPRDRGKSLTGNKTGLWRYRVGDYRIICHIEDSLLLVLVIDIDHRSSVYKSR